MKIQLKEITIKEVANGYKNNDEEGVVGYGEKLNIRPKYQREFVYKDKQRDAVIDTIKKNFPLNVMYWVKNDYNLPDVFNDRNWRKFRKLYLEIIHKCPISHGSSGITGLSLTKEKNGYYYGFYINKIVRIPRIKLKL